MPDRVEDLVSFLYELNLGPKRLKRIRVHPPLYTDMILKCYRERPMVLIEGKPQAFLMGIPVDCDETLTHAFELDYAP